MSQADADAVPIGEAIHKLSDVSRQTGEALTGQLYAANDVGIAWYIMGSVGFVAAAGLHVTAAGRTNSRISRFGWPFGRRSRPYAPCMRRVAALAPPNRDRDRGEYRNQARCQVRRAHGCVKTHVEHARHEKSTHGRI